MLEVSLSINGRSSKVNEHSPKATTIARYYIATRLTAAHWAKFAKIFRNVLIITSFLDAPGYKLR